MNLRRYGWGKIGLKSIKTVFFKSTKYVFELADGNTKDILLIVRVVKNMLNFFIRPVKIGSDTVNYTKYPVFFPVTNVVLCIYTQSQNSWLKKMCDRFRKLLLTKGTLNG